MSNQQELSRYQSWGRTRRPKNPAGDGVAAGVTTIADLTGLDIAGTGSNITTSNKIYKTENQRYMHLHCSGSSAAVTNVYTYLYATQQWSELKHINQASGARSSVACGTNESIVVEVAGADLVAIAGSAGVYMAFSTF